MIFNEMNTNTTVSLESVQESPYELGIGGALMHVYENECNYNALMKAAALSEMKYYNETGGDLFVQEAGAFSSFISKVKEFFKKIIEKIKSIFKKFMAKINQYTMDDKKFVKKYEKDLLRRNLTDFEFDGYKFPDNFDTLGGKILDRDEAIAGIKFEMSGDEIDDMTERNRGKIIGGSSMTESEFRDELKEKFYGDKETLDKINIRKQLLYISEAKKDIRDAEKIQKTMTDAIDEIIKGLEREEKSALASGKEHTKNGYTDAANTSDNTVKLVNNKIAVWKALSNDYVIYFGAVTGAITSRKKQAKAICVKALSYKHEATTVYDDGDDIFSGVSIV